MVGKRHSTKPGSKKSAQIAKLLESILSSVSDALKKPVCNTLVELDLRSELIRTKEVGFVRIQVKLTLIEIHIYRLPQRIGSRTSCGMRMTMRLRWEVAQMECSSALARCAVTPSTVLVG